MLFIPFIPRSWHYGCTNIDELLMSGVDQGSGTFEITELGFHGDADAQMRGFHVDEVSFSSEKRFLIIDNVSLPQNDYY